MITVKGIREMAKVSDQKNGDIFIIDKVTGGEVGIASLSNKVLSVCSECAKDVPTELRYSQEENVFQLMVVIAAMSAYIGEPINLKEDIDVVRVSGKLLYDRKALNDIHDLYKDKVTLFSLVTDRNVSFITVNDVSEIATLINIFGLTYDEAKTLILACFQQPFFDIGPLGGISVSKKIIEEYFTPDGELIDVYHIVYTYKKLGDEKIKRMASTTYTTPSSDNVEAYELLLRRTGDVIKEAAGHVMLDFFIESVSLIATNKKRM